MLYRPLIKTICVNATMAVSPVLCGWGWGEGLKIEIKNDHRTGQGSLAGH